ncbi:hypothetical protein SAMN04487935_2013 [Flavobacterium noncentrifugens]|uniref:Uncharacterized protein n=1 Tax=Flavobacterium noncentrifugens TaxID=1128970 RepID=A0A1G8X0N4_9FLAO|nr:hypothetical protein SAMN04487935_2013 [Flavobacterium noncentrifugens]
MKESKGIMKQSKAFTKLREVISVQTKPISNQTPQIPTVNFPRPLRFSSKPITFVQTTHYNEQHDYHYQF